MSTNWALASNGSTASASSTNPPSSPAACIDGVRHTSLNWPNTGWESVGEPSVGAPDWVEVDFGTTRFINEVDVVTLADAVNYNTNPTLSDVFTQYGITDFKVQSWNGSSWDDVANVTGNNKVWRQFTFSPISTTKIRVLVTQAWPYDPIRARLVEVEAWGDNPPTITTNSLPNGVVGSPYSQTLAVTGGTGSITWSIVSGALPAGLSLNASTGVVSGTPTTPGASSFTARATDSSSAYDDQALSITIIDAVTTKWSRGQFVPKSGLEDWFAGDAALSGGSVPDLSGNVRDFAQATTPPTLQTNVINGYPALYWDGTKNPLVYSGGNVSVQHVFVVGSFGNASFAGSEGLLSSSSVPHLYGDGAVSTKFHDTGLVSVYKKNGVSFAASDMQAPVGDTISIMEVQFTSVQTFSGGVTIGENTSSASLWNGKIAEVLIFSDTLPQREVDRIYKYLAMKYALYKKTAGGLDYFPFVQDWNSSVNVAKKVLLDEAEDGTQTFRTKRPKKKTLDLAFQRRLAEEVDCVDAFYNAHHPGSSFVFVDKSFVPEKETTVRFTIDSEFEPTPSGYTNFAYKLKIKEV